MNAKLQLNNPMDKTQHICQIMEITQETPRTISLKMELSEPCEMDFKPGQFVHFSIEIDNAIYSRYYSVSSLLGAGGSVRITVQKVELGLVSNWLFENASIGMQCLITNPMGEHYLDESHMEHSLALFGAGSGVTPLLPILQYLHKVDFKKPLHVFLSFSVPEDFIFQREFTALTQQLENSHLHVNFTQRSAQPGGETYRLEQQTIQSQCPDTSSFKAFVYGSGSYVTDMTKHLQALNIGHENVLTEHFSHIHPSAPELESGIKVQLDGEILCDNARGDKSILELAEETGAYITSVCRSGLCGACMVRIEGGTHGGCTEALDPKSIENGVRLACCTYPLEDCSVFSDVFPS